MRFDYYTHGRETDNSHPLLAHLDYGPLEQALYRMAPAPTTLPPARLRLGRPTPPSPRMVDHLSLPLPVVSDKVRHALEPLQLPDIQFIPALVETPERHYTYWILHVWSQIRCIDEGQSILRRNSKGWVTGIKRLVLDEQALGEVPAERRQLFRLSESPSVYLWSAQVRDAVLATSPEGIRFWPAHGWSEDEAFRGI